MNEVNTPKVSIIIPLYNYEEYVEQTLMSILLQRINFNVEIVICDDRSTDKSLDVVRRIAKYYQNDKFKFNIIENETNLGYTGNTKKLLDNSTGQYIAYIDADDFWIDPMKLQKQIDFLDNNHDYSMCITGHTILQDKNYIPNVNISNWLCPVNINSLNSESLTEGNIVGSSSSRVFRNYPNLSHLIYDNYSELFPFPDWIMNFEYSLLGKIGYLDFSGYIYRLHGESEFSKDKTRWLEQEKNMKMTLKNQLERRKTLA